MKLMTHNMLMSPGTRNGFPLAIEVEKMEVVEAEFNADFCARMIEKLEWAALVATVASVRAGTAAAIRNSSRNSFAAHLTRDAPRGAAQAREGRAATGGARGLRDERGVPQGAAPRAPRVEIVEGVLVCPETDKRFPIKEGIPSML